MGTGRGRFAAGWRARIAAALLVVAAVGGGARGAAAQSEEAVFDGASGVGLLGSSIAISGDTAAAGAPGRHDNWQGFVHLFERSVSTLFVGMSALEAPFKGGTLVPFPHVMLFGLPTGPLGEIVLTAPWPAGLPPGFALRAQHWITDAAGPVGLAASNAVVGTVP